MKFRNMAGAFVFWALLVGCLALAGQGCQGASVDESTVVAEFMELSEYGSFSPEDLCQSLCGECSCRGTLVSENVCQCSCDFSPDSEGGKNCSSQVQRLCDQMDVQCDFNGPEEDYVREPRGCHSMSCYEKHHEHDAGDYGGYQDGEGYGYDDEGHGHGGKQLICCKDKKHKEKKHKHKKHKKFHEKHMKFHVVIKGKIPEPSCHEGQEGEGHYGGYDEHEGYRATRPDKLPINPAHAPMDVTVWTNRQKFAKKHPFRRPFQQPLHQHQQHYAPSYPPPYPAEARGKSAEPPSPGPRPEPMPEPMHPPQDSRPPSPPQAPPSPPPPAPEPESPPVTPFPERPLTPPPNLYDGAPVGPKKPPQEPPKAHKFSPPSPPPPPPPPPPSHYSRPSPPMITVDPPSRRIESSRSFAKPSSYSSCQFDSYDLNYYHAPPSYHLPAPPPPPAKPSSYRSYYSSSYDSSYPSSHYHPHAQYENSKHYSAYDEPVDYSTYDDSPYDSREYYPDGHGVHPFSDNEIEDWPEFPSRSPADMFTYNQIVSRQIIEADTARRYMAKPFQPTPRPLRDEFEPPTAEVGPVLYESFGPPEKSYDMYPALTPPPDAFIPPVPAPAIPVEFPEAEHEPVMFPKNSEEALYAQPTPPPHYLLAKETGSMSSFGFESFQPEYSPHWESSEYSGYGRSAAGQSHYRAASSRSSLQHSRRYN